ncbi:XdhC family protein [Streptomyces sp. NPDC048290]|uniref:XdhC family protein n=1 Tax=Streptomyces sp. NPDC048290 TaxID=3155811 RepID=UPI003423ED09
MRELAETARRWATEGRPAVLARPLTERGFGPRRPSDALLVDARGATYGALYRGAFDALLVAETAALLGNGDSEDGAPARVCAVVVHGDQVAAAGLTCGGQAELLLQPLSAVPERWWRLLADGADAALVTRLNADRTRAVSEPVTADDGDATPAAAEARRLLARHRAGRATLAADDGPVLIETCPAVPHLIIAGGGELAALLTAQAGLLDWRATEAHTAREVAELIAARPAAACLIVLSHEPDLDVPALRTALTTGVPYVGALGSRPTQARRTAALVETGVSEELLARVHGPIGLDIGARTPAETALTICAEVLAALHARLTRHARRGPVRARGGADPSGMGLTESDGI